MPPDELLPPDDGAGDKPPKAPNQITCEFCGCKLTRHGEIVRLGAEAKAFRKAEETIEELKGHLAQAEAAGETIKREAETLRNELAALKTAKTASRGGW
jgi:hypothetical protein